MPQSRKRKNIRPFRVGKIKTTVEPTPEQKASFEEARLRMHAIMELERYPPYQSTNPMTIQYPDGSAAQFRGLTKREWATIQLLAAHVQYGGMPPEAHVQKMFIDRAMFMAESFFQAYNVQREEDVKNVTEKLRREQANPPGSQLVVEPPVTGTNIGLPNQTQKHTDPTRQNENQASEV